MKQPLFKVAAIVAIYSLNSIVCVNRFPPPRIIDVGKGVTSKHEDVNLTKPISIENMRSGQTGPVAARLDNASNSLPKSKSKSASALLQGLPIPNVGAVWNSQNFGLPSSVFSIFNQLPPPLTSGVIPPPAPQPHITPPLNTGKLIPPYQSFSPIIPVLDINDVNCLVNQPTQLGVLGKLLGERGGFMPGFVQSNKCTYELLRICRPTTGSPFCTPDQCYSMCISDPRCQRVTFTLDGLCQTEARTCQKAALLSSGNSYLRVSPVYGAFPGNCQEHFLTDASLTGDKRVGCTKCTFDECRVACDMIPECVGFSFADNPAALTSGNRQCFLKKESCKSPKGGTHIYYHKLPIFL